MKGSISYRKDRGWWYVSWYEEGKTHKITQYRGERMFRKELAQKLLACMQADMENGIFRLEKYTKEAPTDVVPYLWEWLDAVGSTLKPATYKDYENSIRNHLVPFFQRNPVQLHEIQLDILTRLLNSIQRRGKGKLNTMYALHACLDFAWRSQKIPAMPPFPKKSAYQISQPAIEWLPETRQIAVLNHIPEEHQPIFWWCKYHFRRPGEAMALQKEDFDGNCFTIRRTFSAKKLTQSTKTGEVHIIPCVSDFRRFLGPMREQEHQNRIISPFFFVNIHGKKPGKHYAHATMRTLWNDACQKAGEKIRMYAGLKHSSCCQFLNEKGGNFAELQTITDHARMDSVRRYGKVEIRRKQELMERKIIKLREVKKNG